MPECSGAPNGVHAGEAVGAVDHRLMGEGAAGAAVFLGDHGAEQARLPGLGPDLARKDFVLVPLVDMRHEFGFQEAIGLILEKDKLLRHPGRTRQIERVHGATDPGRFWRPTIAVRGQRREGVSIGQPMPAIRSDKTVGRKIAMFKHSGFKAARLAASGAAAGGQIARRQAQSWPDRPIKFISSQAAGGGTDVLGRLVADQLSTRVGQPVVYENRPGGGNVIGTQAAARSAPDGYTFFFATAAALVVDPYTFKSLPYDPIKDFTVISRIAEVTFMVLAHPDVPAKNLPELFAYAKANPDKLAVATDGARRFSGMVAAWLNKLAGTQDFLCALHADDAGRAGRASPAACSSSSSPSPTAKGHVAAGKLRPLAVTSLEAVAGASRTCRRSPRPSRASISPAGSRWPRRPACPSRSSSASTAR